MGKKKTKKTEPRTGWLNISDGDLKLASGELRERIEKRLEETWSEYTRKFVEAGQQMARDGEIEVDEDSFTTDSDDAGEYILAWLWVTNKEAALRPTRTRKARMMNKTKSFHFDIGNSGEGPIGFCARVLAETKSGAVAKLKAAIDKINGEIEAGYNEDMDGIDYITVYFNADKITGKDIDAVDEVGG